MLLLLRALFQRAFGGRPDAPRRTAGAPIALEAELEASPAGAGGAEEALPAPTAGLPPPDFEQMPPIRPETPKFDRSELMRRMKRIDPQMIRRYRQKSGQ